MKISLKNCSVVATAALGMLCWMTAVAQDKATTPTGKDKPADAAASPQAAAAAKMQAMLKEGAAKPTPRTADGHPNLSGYWEVPGFDALFNSLLGPPGIGPDGKVIRSTLLTFSEQTEVRGDVEATKRINDPSLRPEYKPADMAKVKDYFERSSFTDPSYRCMPMGVPRIGAPTEIVQTPSAAYFLYNERNIFRVIPTDGRQHSKEADAMAMGDSIGHWEGDTLVVDVTNFNPDTWLDMDGAFHDANLHVVERLTRQGDTLKYEVTVEDPGLFLKPFSPKPKTLLVGKSDKHAAEDYPCVELDQEHLVTHEHH
jgi:hypothetical protein